MFPNIRQRIIILAGLAAAGLIYLNAAGPATPADGAHGVLLLKAAQPSAAIGTFIALTIPVIIISAVVGSFTSPLAGVFCLAAALIFPAVRGGSIDSWIRGISTGADFWALAAECFVWMVLLAIAAPACVVTAVRIARRLPRSWVDPDAFPGVDPANTTALATTADKPGGFLGAALWGSAVAGGSMTVRTSDRLASVAATLLSAVIGSLLASLLLRSPDAWQVVWSLFAAFALGSLLATLLLSPRTAMGLMLSPLLAGAFWYAVVAVGGGSPQRLLAAYFSRTFWNPAMALPIFYASAGTAGSLMGYAWAQVFSFSDEVAEETPAELRG